MERELRYYSPMAAPVPETEEMIRRLVALPSVSAADPRLDQSNRAVVEALAEWAEALGFKSEILPVQGVPDKWNLLARLGEGEGGLVKKKKRRIRMQNQNPYLLMSHLMIPIQTKNKILKKRQSFGYGFQIKNPSKTPMYGFDHKTLTLICD